MNILIIAPHCDDELIGCYGHVMTLSPKHKIDVLYVFGNDFPIITKESKFFNRINKFIRWKLDENYFDDSNLTFLLSGLTSYDMVYTPSLTDSHFNHRVVTSHVNSVFNKEKIRYYSVEMIRAVPLDYDIANEKEKEMLMAYPNQYLDLLNSKYYRFESIAPTDVNSFIRFGFRLIGEHCWPDAEGSYAEVLRLPHSHGFVISGKVSVLGHNREIEFLEFSDKIKEFTKTLSPFKKDEDSKASTMSCEQIAAEIIDYINKTYIGLPVTINVMEDEFHGAELIYPGILYV